MRRDAPRPAASRRPASRQRSARLALVCSLALLPSCAEKAAPPADPAVLLEADRAFAAAVAEGGRDAWVAWFTDDGAQIQPGRGEVRGQDALRELMAGLDDPNYELAWKPHRAEISAAGDLGWTTGSYRSRGIGPDGTPREVQGRYVTIWRRQPDGSYKVVMDLGNPVSK